MFKIVRSLTIRWYEHRIKELEEQNERLRDILRSKEKQRQAGINCGGHCFSCQHSVQYVPSDIGPVFARKVTCEYNIPCEKFEKKPED